VTPYNRGPGDIYVLSEYDPTPIAMWDWWARYPSTKIEQIGTPYDKGISIENISTYDYIIVGVVPYKPIKLAPQKHLGGKELISYEGLSLGGRTSINAALYLQGCPEEYKSWGKGWQWEDVAPAFARNERRLEQQSQPTASREGGEWNTRVSHPQYGSSQQYAPCLTFVDPDLPMLLNAWECLASKHILIRTHLPVSEFTQDVVLIPQDTVIRRIAHSSRNS
jgi:hypothetical protein